MALANATKLLIRDDDEDATILGAMSGTELASLPPCVIGRMRSVSPDTWAEKFESFERINSIRKTNGNFDSCNSCKRLATSRFCLFCHLLSFMYSLFRRIDPTDNYLPTNDVQQLIPTRIIEATLDLWYHLHRDLPLWPGIRRWKIRPPPTRRSASSPASAR